MPLGRVLRLLESFALVKLRQVLNAYSPISVTLSGIVISVKARQQSNALQPMTVRLSGSVMLASSSQLLNAYSPIAVMLLASDTLVKERQPANVKRPMLSMPSGMEMRSNAEHSENAVGDSVADNPHPVLFGGVLQRVIVVAKQVQKEHRAQKDGEGKPDKGHCLGCTAAL